MKKTFAAIAIILALASPSKADFLILSLKNKPYGGAIGRLRVTEPHTGGYGMARPILTCFDKDGTVSSENIGHISAYGLSLGQEVNFEFNTGTIQRDCNLEFQQLLGGNIPYSFAK